MVDYLKPKERKTTPEDWLIRRLPYASYLDQLDQRITDWMAHYGLLLMRVALGVIFFWFGALKLVPGLSPAEDLVRNTLFCGSTAVSACAGCVGNVDWLWVDHRAFHARNAAVALFADAWHCAADRRAAHSGLHRLSLWPDDRRAVHCQESGLDHGGDCAGQHGAWGTDDSIGFLPNRQFVDTIQRSEL